MLSPAELFEMDKFMGARADRLIADHLKGSSRANPKTVANSPPKTSNRGRKLKVIKNPFFTFLGPTAYGRYPGFAQDIVEGIARLDWHARPIDTGGKSMPLSVRKCFVILEMLEEVTTAGVQELFSYSQSQAQRYTKAVELALPFMMQAIPPSLIADINGDFPSSPRANEWTDEIVTPAPEELAQLHYDLRTLGRSDELNPHL